MSLGPASRDCSVRLSGGTSPWSYAGMCRCDISCWHLKITPFQLLPAACLRERARWWIWCMLVRRSCLAGSAQKCDLARQGICPGLGQSLRESKCKLAFLGEVRKRHCPELCQRALPIHLEHCTFLSLKVTPCCCNVPVRSAGMCDINRLLKNWFCKRGKVKLHLILRDKVFLAL